MGIRLPGTDDRSVFSAILTIYMKGWMEKNKREIGIFAIGVGVALVFVGVIQGGLMGKLTDALPGMFGGPGGENVEQTLTGDVRGDLKRLEGIEQNFGTITSFFVELAREKGGVHAFEVLKVAEFPPDIDLHLLGHTVGDELFKQEGLEGMKYCTHDFRNACSHSIVIGALLEDGLGVFDVVNDVCKKAPGGPGAYTMCFHGFGHGVLAYTEYEIPDAIELCKRVGTEPYNDREYHECVGGAVMEMNGGVHDPEVWSAKFDKYINSENPIALCQAEYMPEETKPICYSYITPFLFDAAGGVHQDRDPEVFRKAFTYCDAAEPGINQDTCYSGLGKEFIVLVQDRDIRKIEDTPDEKLALAAEWCDLAGNERARDLCKLEILNSLYWGGENHYNVSLRYCGLLSPQQLKNECFARVIDFTTYYRSDREFREGLCGDIPNAYKTQCERVLLN